jgi:hypothetical protein
MAERPFAVVHISVNVDVFWGQERADMSSEFIKQILRDREAQRELMKRNRELGRLGKSQAPMLFKMLKDQVSSHVAEFNREDSSGQSPIEFHFQPSNKFTVRHSNFPVITLDVELDDDAGTISYRRTEKKSASAETNTAEEGVMFVMSGSNADQAYYSIKGEPYREQERVSALLLTPILRSIP